METSLEQLYKQREDLIREIMINSIPLSKDKGRMKKLSDLNKKLKGMRLDNDYPELPHAFGVNSVKDMDSSQLESLKKMMTESIQKAMKAGESYQVYVDLLNAATTEIKTRR